MKTNSTEKIVEHSYSNVKVGDYMLNDGTTVNPDEMTEEQRSQAIGIVAYLYEEQNNAFLKDGVKTALKAKGIEKPHGIVIALKNADGGERYEWSNKEKNSTGIVSKSLNEQIFYGADGVLMTEFLPNIEEFPAFKAAKDYEKEVHAPKNTTGWYLPSIGEWFCMLNHYKDFSEYIRQNKCCWSSSEYSSDNAYYVYFCSDGGFNYHNCYYCTYAGSVRPVLAF